MTTLTTPPDLREALDPIASWLAARDGYGFTSELAEDGRETYRGYAIDLIAAAPVLRDLQAQLATLEARIKQVEAERDAALKTMEMCVTSGGFHAKHAENATARADALERAVTGLGEERQKHMRWLGLSDDMPASVRETAEGLCELAAIDRDRFRARAALAQQEPRHER